VTARAVRRGLVLAACPLGLLAASRPGLQPSDLHRLKPVVEARISPDGRRVAYAVRDGEGEGAPRLRASLIDVATGLSRPLASGAAWHPRWSPDGSRLAFTGLADGGPALMVAEADGSVARVLAPLAGTNDPLPSTAESFAWSPDGRRIAFVSALPAPPAGADPLVISRYLYKPTAFEGASRLSDGRRMQVFVVDVAGGAPRQLTSGDHHSHSPAWSPAGDEVVFVSDRDGDERVFNYDLWTVHVAGGALRRLTDTRSAEYAPAWAPDGTRIAYLGTRRPLTSSETTMEDEHVWTIAAAGAGARDAGGGVDNRQGEPAWDGADLIATVQERGDVALYRFPAQGPATRLAPPAGQRGVIGSWSRARDGTLAYAMATVESPAELFVQGPRGAPRRLTFSNDGLLRERARARVEPLRFSSFDGLEIEAFLTHPLPPAEPRAPRAHPMIVMLHGGPHAQQGPAFHARAQVYAARGWASLQVNYRGSTGYGQKLADAIFGDQNGGEAKDVVAAVGAALARHAWLDPDRVGVEGGSYGGQLVNWLVTQGDHFRAGVSTAGISNLVSFNYTAYYHDYLAVEFGGYPHERGLMDRLWERSPLRFVARARTPLLLLHGENDNDVPVAEAEQFYVALHDVGVPAVLVRYPREGHGLRETAHQVDALRRSIEWYERWFTQPRPEPRPLRTP
jgi:dipeptidyl aminopeptidase/acylaminoacyl peptidase